MMDRGRSRSPRRDRRDGGNKERKTRRGPPERRVFISNLPFDMKWQEVKDLFRKEVGEVSYVELFDDESGKSRGAGVMEFNTVELTKKAIDTMHRFEYKGRKIVVKEDFDVERDHCGRIISGTGSGRRDDRSHGGGGGMLDRSRGGGDDGGHGYTYGLSPQFLDSLNISGPIHNRIFVANLDYKVDERKLKEVFRIAGKVLGVELSRDKDGKSRGFATVVYDHPVESVQAISMFNNQQLYDRKINVRFDKIPEEEPVTNLSRLPDGLRNIGMGLGQDGMPLTDVRANLPGPGESGGQGGGNNVGGGGGLSSGGMLGAGVNNGAGSGGMMGGGQASNGGGQMNNVGTAALQAALQTIMGMGMGGSNSNNTGNSMMDNNSGMAGNSRPDFSSGGGGGGLLGAGGSMDRMGGGDHGMGGLGSAMSSGMGSMASTSSGLGSWGAANSMGNSMTGGNSLGGRRSDSIMVRNLTMDCTWQMLKDRFAHVGDIKYAEMKDRGVGVIRFGSERDADRAVSMMNGQRLDGRNIQVAFY